MDAKKKKSANSSSHPATNSLERLWVDHQRMVSVVKRRLMQTAPEDRYEKIFWMGYSQALRDMGTVMSMQIAADILKDVEKPQASETADGAAPLCRDTDLPEVQELPRQKAG